MASVKKFKKDINRVLSEVIEECYKFQSDAEEKVSAKAEKIIDEAITTFDELIAKMNKKDVDNFKEHFKEIETHLKSKSGELLEKLEKLKA
jgi:polyhydroxyalkanoate synthesis regulator phasin